MITIKYASSHFLWGSCWLQYFGLILVICFQLSPISWKMYLVVKKNLNPTWFFSDLNKGAGIYNVLCGPLDQYLPILKPLTNTTPLVQPCKEWNKITVHVSNNVSSQLTEVLVFVERLVQLLTIDNLCEK